MTYAEQVDLTLARRKRHSITLSLCFRAAKLGSRIFGDAWVTKRLCDLEWVSWRLAYEGSSRVLGYPEYMNDVDCVTPQLLSEIIPDDGTVLDIGCGHGRLCEMAAPFASKVVGIDHDAERINNAVAKARNVELRLADVTLGLPNEHFDVVLLSHILEHLDDSVRFLTALHQLTNTIVVVVPDFDSDPLNYTRQALNRRWYTDDDHIREYTPQLLYEELEHAGWSPSKWNYRSKMMLVVACASNAASNSRDIPN
jgi:SAM-dependent methyltransferase